MNQVINFTCKPEEVKDLFLIENLIREKLKIKKNQKISFRWHRRSIDARQKQIKINASFEVAIESALAPRFINYEFPILDKLAPQLHIIGAGPAGLFAALQAITRGYKPIIYERGKDIRSRRRDLAKLTRDHILNPDSNYCFGEGGAGTYSDGKLYTRSKKRGDVQKVLEWMVQFGATEDILIDAHPHIGTNKLPKLIEAIRNKIISCGGEIYFEHKLTNLFTENGKIHEIEINGKKRIVINRLILATGHSARDIFDLLFKKQIKILAKPFALGVRVEHTQDYIDRLQYHGRLSDEFLPPAAYSMVTQVDNRGVYSFCMCPGGIIAPCATGSQEVVTNGWSPSKRNNIYANSGIVVGIEPSDFEQKNNPFVCLEFQKNVEKACWEAAGKTQSVPAQGLQDFVNGNISTQFPRSSYQPGIVSVNLKEILPDLIYNHLRKAFIDFNKKMPGFITNDAVVHAPESRTSSPILIPRNALNFQHVEISNLYPIAEGAGYAGGIVSAAIDGINCIEKIVKY